MPDINLLPEELRGLEEKEKKKSFKKTSKEKTVFHEVEKEKPAKKPFRAFKLPRFSSAKKIDKPSPPSRSKISPDNERLKKLFTSKNKTSAPSSRSFSFLARYHQWRAKRKKRREILKRHQEKQEALIKLFTPEAKKKAVPPVPKAPVLPALKKEPVKPKPKQKALVKEKTKQRVKGKSRLVSGALNFFIILLVLIIIGGGIYFAYSKNLLTGFKKPEVNLNVSWSEILQTIEGQKIEGVYFTDYRVLDENKIFLKGRSSSQALLNKQLESLERTSNFKKMETVSIWPSANEIIFEVIIYLK